MSALHTRLAPMLGLPLGATDDAFVEAVRRLAERPCTLVDVQVETGLAALSPWQVKALADAGLLAVRGPACWGVVVEAIGEGRPVFVTDKRAALAVLCKSKGEK